MDIRVTGLAAALLSGAAAAQAVAVTGLGGMQRWHAITVMLDGPAAAEQGTPNPFLDYRMVVTFTHRVTGLEYAVPGYFAADGKAAETSADAGDKWRAHLCPDRAGRWDFAISFRAGTAVAVDDDPGAGKALAPFDGAKGDFTVVASDKSGRDLRGKGRLRWVGRHHLQFQGGEWFLKAGADSPENLLACDDFDDTPNQGGRRKSWAAHVQDWRAGDPTWQGQKGKGIVGASSYLAGEGLNAVSFLTYSFHGDDGNVFPYRDPQDRLRMDCSKLDQWEIVFEHAGHVGLFLHFKTQETENDQDMDGGELGVERKLYYRELVARFAHHLALEWNLGEENTNTTAQRKAFARWFAEHDPYRHPVVVHTYPNEKSAVYGPLLGAASELRGASLQSAPAAVAADTATWRSRSAAAGVPWVVANDEQGPASTGIKPDAADPTHDAPRRDVLWGNLMAGGAGIESYFGYSYPHSDLTCEDFRSRDLWWDQCRHALAFFGENRVPFWLMQSRDELVDRGTCLAGASYHVVYLSSGGTAELDLSAEQGVFEVKWYDPRQGGALLDGSVTTVSGGGGRALGKAPVARSGDWTILVRPKGTPAGAREYGKGCAGSGGRVPALAADGLPALGNHAFGAWLLDGLPSSAAVFLVGATAANLPLPGGCALLVDGFGVGVSTDAEGKARLALPVPVDKGLLGGHVYLSGAVSDPSGALFGAAAIAGGLDLELGY